MADATPKTRYPYDEEFHQLLLAGGELLRRDRVEEAKADFLAALALRPDDPKALGLLGLAYFRLSAFEEALPVYEKLVAATPLDPSPRLNLGLVYLKLGDAEQAIAELSRSRDLDPGQSRAASYLGLAYARNGDYAAAYRAFLQAEQQGLAREMEAYLTEEERASITAALGKPRGLREIRREGSVAGNGEATPNSAALAPQRAKMVMEKARAAAAAKARRDSAKDHPLDGPGQVPLAASRAGVVIEGTDTLGAISRAVQEAAPSVAAAAAARRTALGHEPPQLASEFATSRLIRPEDGEQPFEISGAGLLIVRVIGRILSRTEGVIVSGGELAYEPATKRMRGAKTDEPFSNDGRPLFYVSGQGHLVASPLEEHFAAVLLDEDIFYLRDHLVFAFEERLRWENGRVPGSAAEIPMVQFRGSGAVAFRSKKPLVAVKLAPERVLYVDVDAIAGWIGRVVPRVVAPSARGESSAPFVECTGEGIVLLEEYVADPGPGTRAG